MHESPVRELQQAVPHVAAQPAPAPPGQPGVPGGAPLAARVVPEGVRLLPEVSGGAGPGDQARAQGEHRLSVLLAQVRVRPGPVRPPLTQLRLPTYFYIMELHLATHIHTFLSDHFLYQKETPRQYFRTLSVVNRRGVTFYRVRWFLPRKK